MKVSNKWVVTGNDGWSVSDKDYSLLTYGGCGCCGGGPDAAIDDEPVARLMASAPELLQALRDIEKWGSFSVNIAELLERLKDIELSEE